MFRPEQYCSSSERTEDICASKRSATSRAGRARKRKSIVGKGIRREDVRVANMDSVDEAAADGSLDDDNVATIADAMLCVKMPDEGQSSKGV